MKKRELKGPSTDLLVCFPTRSHLTLMPKTICSPSRSSNTYNHRGGDSGLWSKRNHMGSGQLSEPTSPKVTCAGQIKARPKSRPCKNWQSVMEEIERFHIHSNKQYKKKLGWSDALGFKKESMQFLTCLRSFKFDLGCFGAFPNAKVTSDDDDGDNNDDNDEDDDEINHVRKLMGFEGYDHDEDFEGTSSKSAFSKWFMFLEEKQNCGFLAKEEIEKPKDGDPNIDDDQVPCVPPSNALLLMRCRSAPTKSMLEEKEKEGNGDDNDEKRKDNDDDDDNDNDNDKNEQYDDGKKSENLMELMKYEGDFYKLSCDIAKETWVVGGTNKDPCSRTQSSKRSLTECLQEVKACLQ